MSLEYPLHIRSNIEGRILEKYPLAALVQAAETVSLRYRREAGGKGFQIQSEVEALSYLAARMPATYAANAKVMSEVIRLYPDFRPESVLDVGAGPGTASLCAVNQFETIKSSLLIEPNRYLKQSGRDFLSSFTSGFEWGESKVENLELGRSFDLVLASYVFNEIEKSNLNKLVEKIWSTCSKIMIIIEPGIPQGAGVIQSIRNWAIKSNISILAPCPQVNECPLANTDSKWCHFSVRISRSKLHKTLKGGDAGFEDEKFSYIVLSRERVTPPEYRLIGHPSGTKLRELQVCGKNGAETLKISKSNPSHKASKKLEWGDGFDG